MKCPVCGGAELVANTSRLMPFEWQGKETMLEVRGDACPLCGEIILNEENAARVEEQMKTFKDGAASEYPAFIKSVRGKLGLTQKEAGELFGGGVNGFSRYELGKASPPTSLVALFRLLDKHPALLEEIRQGAS